MVTDPAERPVNTPVTEFIVPMPADAILLLQVPPPASVNVVVVPGHAVSEPLIGFGAGFTVTTAVATQPFDIE